MSENDESDMPANLSVLALEFFVSSCPYGDAIIAPRVVPEWLVQLAPLTVRILEKST
jgi:hypothetical protein